MGDYLDRWLGDCVRDSVKRRTYGSYAVIVRRHIAPALGAIKLSALSPAHVQRLYREKLGSGLSPTTVEHVHTTISKALKQAVRWGLIPRNVSEAVVAPKRNGREMRPLDARQARAFLRAAQGSTGSVVRPGDFEGIAARGTVGAAMGRR